MQYNLSVLFEMGDALALVFIMLNLQPNEDHDIDNQDCEIVDDKYEEVESCHLKILIDEVIIIEF